MLIVLTSPAALDLPVNPDIVQALKAINSAGHPVALVSNNGKPAWFDAQFQGSNVQFLQETGRQKGNIVSHNATLNGMQPFDVVVIAASDIDIQMGKNGKALVVGAGWTGTGYTKSLGIRASNAAELQEVVRLTSSWAGNWWFSGAGKFYSVRALADLSTYGKDYTQAAFANSLTSTAKNGGVKLNSLLAITARSLLMDGFGEVADLFWGVYPSSNSANNDTEILSDFTQRLRTTVSRVRNAAAGKPLFIRHAASVKRSAGGAVDRTDPSDQITTLHINPYYRGKLNGRNVVVIDDCTTYGVSFGVAAAFLRKAGAASVTGVAVGKFGSQLRYFDIDIKTSDPFSPVRDFSINASNILSGTTSQHTQNDLSKLI